MRVNTTVKKRVFDIEAISEEEGLVLRTLLNLSEEGVREKLNDDSNYWNDDLSEDEAVIIGRGIVTTIMEMVDNKE